MKTSSLNPFQPVIVKGVIFKNRMMMAPLGFNVEDMGSYLHAVPSGSYPAMDIT